MGTGTGIGRVRGLGSAKHGAQHWWRQRLTAGGNLVLLLWFITSIVRLPVLDHKTVVGWMASPFVAVPLILLTINVFYHLRLGLQVVIEDYQHDESRIIALVALNFYTIGCAALAIFAIAKIAFGGVAG